MNYNIKIKSSVLILMMCLILSLTSVISFAISDDTEEKYIDQIINNTQNDLILMNSGTEYINPFHGNLNLKYVDLSLPGINGLDFNLIREYNSNDSYAFDIDNSTIIDSENNARYDIGAGWSFNIPYMKYVGDIGTKNTYQIDLGERGTFILEQMGVYGGSQAEFKGFKNHDMDFYPLQDTTECVVNGKESEFVFMLGDGTKYYFALDYTINAVRDKFGNQISYEHTVVSNTSTTRDNDTRYFIDKVTDTIGREINFDYSGANVVVSVNGEGLTQSVTYAFDMFKDITALRPEVMPSLLEDTDKVLKSVTNTAGMTTSYTYDVQAVRKNYTSKSITTENKDILFALMSSVDQPGGLTTKYDYITSIKNSGIGAVEFFKINSRFDEVPNGTPTPTVANTVSYGYAFEAGTEYDGYPNYSETTGQSLPNNFRIRVAVTTETSLTDYVADKDLKVVETLTTTDKLVTKETKVYDNDNNLDSVTTEISDPTTAGDNNIDPVVSTVLYEHDTEGHIIGYWGSQTPSTIDALGDYTATNDEYKTTSTLDSRFNIPTSTISKQDLDTTIEEKNILSADGKKIIRTEVYENGVIKSKVAFSYDSYGNVSDISTYADGINVTNVQHFSYANSGENAYPTSTWSDAFTDVDGNAVPSVQTSNTYDYFGNTLTTSDANGNVTTVVYDNLNRPTKVTNPDNTTQDIVYTVETDGFNIVKTDEAGNDFKLEYNSLGQSTQVIDVLTGNVHVINEYDTMGRLTKTTDALGNYSVFSYYGNGEKKTAKAYSSLNALLSSVNFIREVGVEDGKYIAITEEIIGDANAPTQRSTTYVNAHGLVEKNSVEVNGVDETETFTYDYIGRPLEFTSARILDEGLSSTYSWKKEYDHAGNVVKFFNAEGDFTTNVYDDLNQLLESYDFMSNKVATPYATKKTYDDLGRLIKEEVPFDNEGGPVVYSTKEYLYDANNNLVEERASNNEIGQAESFTIRKFDYDKRNRLIKVTLENGASAPLISQYYHDEVGNQVRMYTGLSSPLTIIGIDMVSGSDLDYTVSKMDYDHLSNITKYTDPMNQIESYGYNLNGNMTSKTDRNGTVFTNTYDGLGRLTFRTAVNGSETHNTGYTYNTIGLVQEVNDEGYVESFEYNDRGLVTKHNYPDYYNSYTYNVIGSVERVLSFRGSDHIQTAHYNYDNLDRLSDVSDLTSLQATYTYDANGNRNDVKYTTGTFGADYTYNLANIVTGINNFNSGATASAGNTLSNVLPDYNYVYKLNGSQVSEIEVLSSVVKSYSYDDINRMINESKAMNGSSPEAIGTLTSSDEAPDLLTDYSLDYTFDDFGNILTKVDGTKTSTYTYDKNNRIVNEEEVDTDTTIIKKFSYDKNGNTISDRTEVYMKNPSNVGSSIDVNDSGVKIYEYNLLNQQIKVTTKNGTTTYKYNASGLRDSKTIGTDETKFFWNGTNIIGEAKNDVIVASYLYGTGLINREDKVSGDKNYYFFNVHGDVVAITDETGEVVTVYDYNAYGEFSQRGLDLDNPFMYFSQYYDEETGSYYLRARYYNPNYMRFTQEDTYVGTANDPLSLNRYLYVVGNPTLFIDPSGEKPKETSTESDYNRGKGNTEDRKNAVNNASSNMQYGYNDMLAIAAGFTPADTVLDIYAVFKGENLISGESENRWIAAGAIFLPEILEQGVKKGSKLGFKYLEGTVKLTKFKGDEAVNHFGKHGKELMDAFGKDAYNLKNYVDDANHVLNNGTFVKELNGYVQLIGGKGSAKYGFVGLDRATGNITTFHIKTATELSKKAPSLGIIK